MKKPLWLKKSYLKYNINNVLFSVFSIFIPKNKSKNKILVTELDGIGDIVVRSEILDLLAEKYGKENIIVLVTFAEDLIALNGYQYEVFEKNSHYNFLKLLKLYKKIARYGFWKFYSLEFLPEDKLNFLKKVDFEEVYGFRGGVFDKWNQKKKSINLIDKNGEKVLNIVFNYARKFINTDLQIEDMRPNLKIKTIEKDYISLGIGTSDRKRQISPVKMKIFLNYIMTKNSKIKIHILGNGKNDELYFNKLLCLENRDNLVSYVSKLSLLETTKQITDSKLYIGFDSGLYNIAYALNKKIIVIVDKNISPQFRHNDPKIRFLYKEMNIETKESVTDEVFGNENINSISIDVFKKAFEDIGCNF